MRVLTLAFVLLPLLALLLLASTCCSLVKRLTQISWTSSSEKWTAIYFGGASDFAGENKEARKLGDLKHNKRNHHKHAMKLTSRKKIKRENKEKNSPSSSSEGHRVDLAGGQEGEDSGGRRGGPRSTASTQAAAWL